MYVLICEGFDGAKAGDVWAVDRWWKTMCLLSNYTLLLSCSLSMQPKSVSLHFSFVFEQFHWLKWRAIEFDHIKTFISRKWKSLLKTATVVAETLATELIESVIWLIYIWLIIYTTLLLINKYAKWNIKPHKATCFVWHVNHVFQWIVEIHMFLLRIKLSLGFCFKISV